MNVTKNQIDDLNATIKIQLDKDDYATRVSDALKDYQKRAVIDGFRKGKTPFGIIKKMYGKAVLIEEINKLIGESLSNYIQENDLNILGEPLPSETEQKELNLDEESFEFVYDIALSPAMNVKLSKREKVPYYIIKVDDEMIDKQIESICKSNGELTPVDTIEGSEYVKGELIELGEDGKPKEGGIHVEDASLSVEHMKDEEQVKIFTGKQAGNEVIFNPSKTYPNKTDYAALLLWLHQQKINYMDYRDNTEILEQLTFSTERKYMATLVRSVLEGKLILYLKGAPEIVFAKCKQVETPAGLVPAQEYHATVEKELLDFQNQAMRTLGFAYKLVDSASEGEIEAIAQEDFIFLGIAAISDPVRPDVPAAVAKCLNAGIDVKIVTGDTPATAREIGRQIGIWKSEDSEEQIITGVDFEKLPDEEAAKRVLKLKIMCRARPTDKQRLVELLKQSGAVVAVTGDGTNDAPALNHADVGLSMGSGTSVAKEASDITLLDDSFNSIATAVMWGRSLYHNIQRFILFQLTINLSALLIVLIGSMFGRELPLTVTQMLWVNMIIDTFAAAALASLPPNPKVMNEMPRKSTDFIISPKMRNYILGIGLSFTVLLLGLMYWFTINDGVMSRHDLSVFFTTFVMLQFWNMFNAKAFLSHGSAFKNLKDSTGFLIVMFIIPIGQYLIVQFGGEVFRTVPLSWKDWGIIVGLTSLVLWIGEILRLMKKQ